MHVSVIIIKLNRFLIINIVWFQKIYTPPGGGGGGGWEERAKNPKLFKYY